MTNADSPAFPQPEVHAAGACTGLTKVEFISTIIMAGIIASDTNHNYKQWDGTYQSKEAIRRAEQHLYNLEANKADKETKTQNPTTKE